MASVFSKESMLTRNKLAQKKLNSQTMKTLNQLLMRPNITISKKSILLKNCNDHTTETKKVVHNLTKGTSESTLLNSEGKKSKQKPLSENSEPVIRTVGRSMSLIVPENVEFYPDKPKRNIETKKVVLQPKHDYRVIATTNKRKRRIPHRELNSPLPEEPDLTMAELVRLADEEGIDDEDLMEILTCPSPVWWEDYNYKEEICIRFHDDTNDQANAEKAYHHNTRAPTNIKELLDNNNLIDSDCIENRILTCDKTRKSLKNDVDFLKKFIKKRSKLENVLGSIKIKKTKSNESQNSYQNKADGKVRKDSTSGASGLSDSSFNEEELLKTLENIEIPVQKCSDSEEANITEDANIIDDTVIIINNNPDADLTDDTVITINNNPNRPVKNNDKCSRPKRVRKNQKLTRKQRNSKKNNKIDVKLNQTCDEINIERNNEIKQKEINKNEVKTDLEMVPADLPPLTKCPFRNAPTKSTVDSPKSIENSTYTIAANSKLIEFDSISDTNIKFLDEFDDEKTEPNKNETGIGKSNTKTSDELVTIYRIIPNNDNLDIEEHIKMNLVNKSPQKSDNLEVNKDIVNKFYKKRNNTLRSKIVQSNKIKALIKDMQSYKMADTDATVRKANKTTSHKYEYKQKCRNRVKGKRIITIPNTKVKYCYTCSSIFESDTCQYCTKKP